MLILILASILVGLSSFLLTRILFSKRNNVDFILSWFILFLAQIIIVELYLGIIGKLYLTNIIFAHLIIFLIIFLIYRRKVYPPFSKPDISFIFNNKILLFSIAIFLGFFLVKVWNNLINPPICPESYQYHLSFPATWFRDGNLKNPLVVFGPKGYPENFTALTYYPISAELYFYWLMAPLKNAFLADIGQVPFYIVGILTIYSILRKFLINKETALFLGVLWVLIPNLFKQIRNGAQVDVMCAVLFLIILNYLLIINKETSFKNFILLGTCLGLFISVKAINIFWAFSFLPLFIYIFLINNVKNRFLALFIIFFFTLLIGGYSYINNYILTGNIFYPITFRLFGKTIMPGTIDKETFAYLLYSWEDFRIKDVLFSEGLGLQLFAFVIPGAFIPLPFLTFLRKKFNHTNFKVYLFIFVIPLIMLLEYFFYIKAFWIRYFFPFLGMGLLCFAIFLNKFNWAGRYITIAGTIAVISSMAELAKRTELIISLIISAAIFFILLKWHKKIIQERIMFAAIIFILLSLFFLNNKYNREEAGRYALLFKGKESKERDIGLAWQWVHKDTSLGRRIAYTGRGEFYPLFGKRLVNDVVYVSINDKPPLAHYYSDGQYRKEQNEEAWLKNLEKNKIEMLVVYLPHEEKKFPIEDDWARRNPEKFGLVFKNNKVKIYSVSVN